MPEFRKSAITSNHGSSAAWPSVAFGIKLRGTSPRAFEKVLRDAVLTVQGGAQEVVLPTA